MGGQRRDGDRPNPLVEVRRRRPVGEGDALQRGDTGGMTFARS